MRRWLLLFAIAACALPIETASARGRSFPIEVTGIIRSFDRSAQRFTFEAEEPAKFLNMGLRYDCKVIGTLKSGLHVRVSYFATIFTGNLAVEIETNPQPEFARGVIEKLEPAERRLTLLISPSRHLVMRWAAKARFVNLAPANLTEGTVIDVSYYSPAFANKYAVKVAAPPIHPMTRR